VLGQLIADVSRQLGFDGVQYRSSISGGYNLCIFEPDTRLVDQCAPPDMDPALKNDAKTTTFQAILSVAELLQREAEFVPMLSLPGTPLDEDVAKAREAFPKPEEVHKKLNASDPSARLTQNARHGRSPRRRDGLRRDCGHWFQ
jgi:hypothetical protein